MRGKQALFALSIDTTIDVGEQTPFIDSGASRHLVMDVSMLIE